VRPSLLGLPPVYVELRDRIRVHIKQIRRSQKKHPEYAVALLIAVASEALSRLRGRRRSTVFVKDLLEAPHQISEAMAVALFRAVRHGLAHRYDTALINVGNQKVVVVITWNRPSMHLKILYRDWLNEGRERAGVHLDTETLWRRLDAYFKKLTTALRRDERLSRQFTRQGKRLDEKYTVTAPLDSLAAWRTFLAGG